MDGLAGTTNADTGQDEACFPFRQVISESNDAAVAVSTTFGSIDIDEAGDGQRIKAATGDATGTPQPEFAASGVLFEPPL